MDKKLTHNAVKKCSCKCDDKFTIVSSQGLGVLLGYTSDEEMMSSCGGEILGLIHDKDKKEFLKTFLRTGKQYGKPAGAFRFMLNGAEEDTTFLLSATYSEEEGFISLSFFDPVFAYKEALQTRGRLDMLLDNLQAGIALIEMCGDKPKVLHVNPALEGIVENVIKYTKLTDENVSLKDLVVHSFDKEFVENAKNSIESGIPMDYVVESRHSVIKYFFRVRGMQVPYESSENVVFMVIITDITEYKKTEKRLEEMANELTGVINNVPGGIAMFSVGATIDDVELEYANDALYHMVGSSKYRQEEIAAKDLADFIHHDDFENVSVALMECAHSGKETECVFRLISMEGKATWCHLGLAANHCEEKVTSVLGVFMDITAQQEMSELMKISQEKFKLAFEQTNATIWEYDIHEDTVYSSNVPESMGGGEIYMPDPVTFFSENGIICEESMDDLERMITMTKEGVERGSCVLKVKNINGGLEWHELSFVTVFDEEGKPSTAVCISKRMDNMSDLHTRFTQEETIFELLSRTEGITCVMANLTGDYLLKSHLTGSDTVYLPGDMTWSEFIKKDARYTIPMQKEEEYIKAFDKDNLLQGYIQGEECVTLTLKRQYNDGKIRWVSYLVNLLTDPITGDVFLFGYFYDVDIVKTAELALDKNPEFSSTTGLYTMETARAMASKVIAKQKMDSYCSLLILSVYDYEAKLKGEESRVSEKTFSFISKIMSLMLGGSCIIADAGDDSIMIFVPSAISDKWLMTTIDNVMHSVQLNHALFENKDMFDYSVGICTETLLDTNFDEMLKNAKESMVQAQTHVSVHEEAQVNINMPVKHDSDDIATIRSDLFITCAAYLLTNEPVEISVTKCLKEICDYFKGDRAYVIETDINTGKINHYYEWCALCLDSQRHFYTEKDIRGFSALQRAYITGKPVVIENIDYLKSAYERDELEAMDISSMIILPYTFRKKPSGFIGVDNPEYLEDDVHTLNAIAYLIISKILIHKLQEERAYSSTHDELTGLLNRKSFVEYVDAFKPDAVTSLGVLSADINSLKQINEKYGNAYGNEIIKFIASSMCKYFDINELYKFAGDEFVAVCENVTFEAFEEKVNKLQEEIQESHPNAASLGFTWADEDIDVEKLLNNAEELMMISKKKYYQSSNVRSRYYDPEKGKELIKDIENGRFVLFLQPKAASKTGKISGAEALVRMYDHDQGIIYPDKFIPAFEQQNMIRYIDLFIFEETLKVLQGWQKQGIEPITVSLNFSRSTVLEPDIIETMDEIFGKYNVDRKYVEIEITESMGDMEIETIRQICNTISDKGYRISLDDFGSKYSSMVMLTTIKFDVIKIDKSIIHDIITNKMNQILMKNIFHACDEMGIEVVAEGVETQEQFDLLAELGCTYAQGYLFNKPIPWKEFEKKYIV